MTDAPSAVLWLDQVRAADAPAVGAKAARLGELASRGFPVPPGFVVTADAYREAFRGLEPDGDVRRRLESAPLPEALSAAIGDAYGRLIRDRGAALECAVRSSATAEDLAGASFAGQHGTYYHVDQADLLPRIRRCWASLWTPEAIAYRVARGIEPAAMAVIVQEMIPSEVAGVAFTANPLTGARGEVVIECCWGMGAALVDGRVSPDHYVLARPGLGIRERRIGDKRVMVACQRAPDGASRLHAVAHAQRRRETLSPALVRAVAEAALACEGVFGGPQDVEWALAGGRLHLLQSRPVTALPADAPSHGQRGAYVLFKPVFENFTEPMTPLTADFFGTLRLPGLVQIDGWLYFDVGVIRRILPLALSDRQAADLLYLSRLPPSAAVSFWKLPAFLCALLFVQATLGITFARLRHLPDDFMEDFRGLCRRVGEDPRYGPLEAFRRLWLLPRMLDPLGRQPLLANVVGGRGALWMVVLRRLLLRWAPGLPPDAWTRLLTGEPGILSAEMGREVAALAALARKHPAVALRLGGGIDPGTLGDLRLDPGARAFVDAFDRFLLWCGHRGVRELELGAARWDEDPAQVLGIIRNHLLAGGDAAAHDASGAREAVEAQIRQALADRPLERALGLRGRILRATAARARRFIKLRENSRFYWIMGFRVVRRKILEIEERLLSQGRLKCRGDIFFLCWAEIVDLVKGRFGWSDLEDRLRERRLTHLRRSRTPPPRTIGIAEEAAENAPAGGDDGTVVLRGQAASTGCYEGLARVVLDVSLDAELRPGEILVAPFTDPAWTPLFLTAGAAVVEVGSFLSHAGTVAREYGLPCVVDVVGCTSRIQTGARLRVDGARGLVQILEEAPA